MAFLVQTFDFPDLVLLILPLVAVILALVLLGAVVLSHRERTWGLLLATSSACSILAFGVLVPALYFSARLAGARASFQLILDSADTSGAVVVVGFIACVASVPFMHLAFSYWGRTSRRTSHRSNRTWLQLMQRLIVAALFGLSIAVGFLVIRSRLTFTVLFGDPAYFEQPPYIRRSLATGADHPFRFSTILERISSTLGFNRTTWSDLVAIAVTIGAILEGMAAFLSLYDRFLGKKRKANMKNHKSDHGSGKLPPPRPMSIDSYRQLISDGEHVVETQGQELPPPR